MKIGHFAALFPVLALLGCDNPGGISDSEYEKYNRLGAPKILYRCTHYVPRGVIAFECLMKNDGGKSDPECQGIAEQDYDELVPKQTFVRYAAGVGAATSYNSLLLDAERDCLGDRPERRKFEILDKKE